MTHVRILSGTLGLALVCGLYVPGITRAEMPKAELNLIGSMGSQPSTRLIEQPFWQKHIPDKSGGAIKVNSKPWDQLGLKGPETFHLVRDGVYDGAAISMAFNSGEIPYNEGWQLAGLSRNVQEARKNADAWFPVIAEHYERKLGIKLLAKWPFPPQLAICRRSLESISDFKGRTVRVSGASQADFVRAFGGTDVNIAFGEVQTGLQNGVVDCALTSSMSAYKAGWYEAAKYVYSLPIDWRFIVLEINLSKWKSLPKEVQDFLMKEAKVLEDQMWQSSPLEHEQGLACLTGKGDCPEGKPARMVQVEVKGADHQKLKEIFAERIVSRWAKACGTDCVRAWNNTVGKGVGIVAVVP